MHHTLSRRVAEHSLVLGTIRNLISEIRLGSCCCCSHGFHDNDDGNDDDDDVDELFSKYLLKLEVCNVFQ